MCMEEENSSNKRLFFFFAVGPDGELKKKGSTLEWEAVKWRSDTVHLTLWMIDTLSLWGSYQW